MNTVKLNNRDLRYINKSRRTIMHETKQQYLELNIPLSDEYYI